MKKPGESHVHARMYADSDFCNEKIVVRLPEMRFVVLQSVNAKYFNRHIAQGITTTTGMFLQKSKRVKVR